jgi:hypothetical protein
LDTLSNSFTKVEDHYEIRKPYRICHRGGVTLIGLGASLPATAAVLVDYQFPGSVFTPTNTAANVTANTINNTGSTSNLTSGPALPNSLAISPDSNGITTPALAVSNNKYFQFSVTPDNNFDIDLTSLNFQTSRGGTSTPRGWVLRSSIDNYAANIDTQVVPTVQPTLTSYSVDLSGTSFQNLTSSVNFRIYVYGPVSGSFLFFDNLTLNGAVSPVVTASTPEPSSIVALLSLAAIGGGAFVKRRIGK